MTSDEILKARELCERATPGPWAGLRFVFTTRTTTDATIAENAATGHGPSDRQGLRDAAFIAASRTLVPRLLDAIDEANRALEESLCPACRELHDKALAAANDRAEKTERDLATALKERDEVRKTARCLAMLVDEQGNEPMAAIDLAKETIRAQDDVMDSMECERNAARKGRDEALRERDSARRLYCTLAHECAMERAKGYASTVKVRAESPREIAISHWPADADLLFPSVEVK